LSSRASNPCSNRSCNGGRRDGTEEILQAYPDLQPEDIQEALRNSAEAVWERELPLENLG
jgi:hypothetical protein